MVSINNLEAIELENFILDLSSVQKIPEEIAIANCLIAFKEDNENLYIAINTQVQDSLQEELKFISCKNIKFFYSERNNILNAINNYYGKNTVQSAIRNIELENDLYSYESVNSLIKEDDLQGPVIKLTNSIVNGAILRNASDIHLEPFQKDTIVRLRVDGIIVKIQSIPKNIYPLICARIKIMASMSITEKRIPQDGKIQYIFENKNYDLRVSTLATIYGEKIAIRVLYKSDRMMSLESLGFYGDDVNNIRSMISNPYGIVLVTGPTGSGKTTTLYSMINSLNGMQTNITSIEDPVEYTLDNVNQVNVNNKINFGFAEGLRSILRQDPDVIMVGEIRDEETAQIAMRAAVTGHLVISTLHTSNAIESILRLKDMGIEPYFMKDALIGIIAQRLIRKICNHCKEIYYPTEIEQKELEMQSNQKLYKSKGCYKCDGTGYKGRTAIYEIINLRELKKYGKDITSLDTTNLPKTISSLKDNCISLVKKGITTYEEFIRINLIS